MNAPKRNRRKFSPHKLEPIDWREFANDPVLNGNMSTLYRRPLSEDPTAYASAEALVEIKKRFVGPTVGTNQPVGCMPTVVNPEVTPTPTEGITPSASWVPTVGMGPATGVSAGSSAAPVADNQREFNLAQRKSALPEKKVKVKPIRGLQDALTLAGQVLYRAMYGSPDGSTSKTCTKGYRQLAAETHLDKDTVRDLICELKYKGIVQQIGGYNPDTRSAKTYEILSYKAILQAWSEAGIEFVTGGRRRPQFCSAEGLPILYRPVAHSDVPTVGMANVNLESPVREAAPARRERGDPSG